MKNRLLAVVATLAVGLAAGGCGPSEEEPQTQTRVAQPTSPPIPASGPPHVTSLEIGRSVNPDKTMRDATVTFKTSDSVYVSIIILGQAQTVAVKGRFTSDDGKPVEESEQKLAVPGRAVVEFHVTRAEGETWPVGHYNFEVFLDGTSAGTKSFEVVS
jgi:hypothetical protein